ncbi:MAG TPA: DUF1028 domain-containing protein [Woeseiaceae bacterium]|nr:DUF1028 domain-containing protein [Woeseiaceae bacterium]
MTFSIVANDRDAGYCGSAVASRSIAVGGTVTYSRTGVGVVNTQHHAHIALGHRVLDEMENGEAPHAALASVLDSDGAAADSRQLIAIDITGRQGGWTGRDCAPECHHAFGAGCVAAGNYLATAEAVASMIEAFEEAPDAELATRLLAALRAADAMGGDRRGRQAAAISVVSHRDRRSMPVNLDLRVDDHPDPIGELSRLHELFRREFEE